MAQAAQSDSDPAHAFGSTSAVIKTTVSAEVMKHQ